MTGKHPSKPSPPRASRATGAPTIDGVCDQCQRVVRGFPGDYAKCAACSKMTLLRREPPPGWRLIAKPNRLAIMPIVFVALFYVSVLGIFLTGQPQAGSSGWIANAVVIVVFAGWIYSIMHFARLAERRKGWWIPVVEYHISSLMMVFCMAWLAAGCQGVVSGSFTRASLLLGIGGLVLLLPAIVIYGDARRRIAHLCIVPC